MKRMQRDPELDPRAVYELAHRCEFGRYESRREYREYQRDRLIVLCEARQAQSTRSCPEPVRLDESSEATDTSFQELQLKLDVSCVRACIFNRDPSLCYAALEEDLAHVLSGEALAPDRESRLRHVLRCRGDLHRALLAETEFAHLQWLEGIRAVPWRSRTAGRFVRRLLQAIGLRRDDDWYDDRDDDDLGSSGTPSPPAPTPGARIPLTRRPAKAGPFPTPFPSDQRRG
ncbi:MAG: hypothetical protein RIS45_1388 [Planctomycetota bacterium]